MRGQQNRPESRCDDRCQDNCESESVARRVARLRRGGSHTVHHPLRCSGIPPNSRDSRENPEPLRERCATIARVRKRVLIVDDHQPFRAIARELLEDAGYIVAGEAADAGEALAAVAADAPDAVLLDVQLPDRGGFRCASRVMTSAAITASPRRGVLRDPVLLLPVAVAAGLAIGWLGVHEGVPGARIAADLALSWALVAASVVMLERPRWRRASWLLAATAFALLGADLEWASSHALWTLGFVIEGLWAAFLVQLVLTFPEGRPWSRAARIAIVCAYAVTFGGQLVGAFVVPDGRDALSVAPHASFAHNVDRAQEISGVAVALVVLFLVVQRLRALRGPARRAQAPLLMAAAVSVPTGVVWLGWAIANDAGTSTLGTIDRAVAVSLPLGVVAGIVWSRLRRTEAS